METEKHKKEINEEIRNAAKADYDNLALPDISPYVKGVMAIGCLALIIWSSQYIFSACAGSIRAFKDLKKSIKQ